MGSNRYGRPHGDVDERADVRLHRMLPEDNSLLLVFDQDALLQ
jgi:hypothetical protein